MKLKRVLLVLAIAMSPCLAIGSQGDPVASEVDGWHVSSVTSGVQIVAISPDLAAPGAVSVTVQNMTAKRVVTIEIEGYGTDWFAHQEDSGSFEPGSQYTVNLARSLFRQDRADVTAVMFSDDTGYGPPEALAAIRRRHIGVTYATVYLKRLWDAVPVAASPLETIDAVRARLGSPSESAEDTLVLMRQVELPGHHLEKIMTLEPSQQLDFAVGAGGVLQTAAQELARDRSQMVADPVHAAYLIQLWRTRYAESTKRTTAWLGGLQ